MSFPAYLDLKNLKDIMVNGQGTGRVGMGRA